MSFERIDPTTIYIAPNRQRQDLGDLEGLMNSIRQNGLIHPVTIDENNVLIAGERRLRSCLALGLAQISVQRLEHLSPFERKSIELEENIKRKEMTWQEEALTVAEYHALHTEEEESWTQLQTADFLSMSERYVGQRLELVEHKDDEKIWTAPKFSEARTLCQRKKEREKMAILDPFIGHAAVESKAEPASPAPAGAPAKKAVIAEIHNVDFMTFEPKHKFNFIHCDFPYGIDFQNSGMSINETVYDDSFEIFSALVRQLVRLTPTLCTPSAHLMFWFAPKFYTETLALFAGSDWEFVKTPLVWFKNDNTGIIPDRFTHPRQVYETAFIARRGGAVLNQTPANCFPAPVSRLLHSSAKNPEMLAHFFRMFIDENTVMLDPTCGSGGAIRTARTMNARYSLGLELNPQTARVAQEALENA